jgi:hypothetical protein
MTNAQRLAANNGAAAPSVSTDEPGSIQVANAVSQPVGGIAINGGVRPVVELEPPLDYNGRLAKMEHVGFIAVIVVSVLGIIGTLSSPVIAITQLGYWGFTALTPAGVAYREGKPVFWKEVVDRILAILPLLFVNMLGAFDLFSGGILGWVNMGLIGAHYLCKGINVYACLNSENLKRLQDAAAALPAAAEAAQKQLHATATATAAASGAGSTAASAASSPEDPKK